MKRNINLIVLTQLTHISDELGMVQSQKTHENSEIR